MWKRLGTAATAAGCLGAVVLVVAIVGRFFGEKPVLGMKALNLYLAGMGAIVWGIWARLEANAHPTSAGN